MAVGNLICSSRELSDCLLLMINNFGETIDTLMCPPILSPSPELRPSPQYSFCELDGNNELLLNGPWLKIYITTQVVHIHREETVSSL